MSGLEDLRTAAARVLELEKSARQSLAFKSGAHEVYKRAIEECFDTAPTLASAVLAILQAVEEDAIGRDAEQAARIYQRAAALLEERRG